MTSHLGLVTIFADDVARTVSFYTELLGFEAIPMFSESTGNFVFLHSKNGNASIAIQNVATRKFTQLGIPEENGGLMLGFMVENAETAYQDWLSKDIELRTELSDMGFGRTFGANDPSGTYIQIYDVIPQALAALKRMEAN